MFTFHSIIMRKSIIILLLTISTAGVSQHSSERASFGRATTHQVPVLVNKQHNPVMTIQWEAEGHAVDAIELDFQGTSSMKDIRSVRVFMSGTPSIFDTARLIATAPVFNNRCLIPVKLSGGVNKVWISLELDPGTDLRHTFSVRCLGIQSGDSRLSVMSEPLTPPVLRAGLALRSHGEDGVDTYRIPGLATSRKGTVMSVYDARRASSRDLQGDIDIVLNRSVDGGRHWEPMQVVLDMKEWGGLPQKFNGVSDASILVDDRSENIFIAGLWMHGVLDERGQPIMPLDAASNAWNHQWRNRGSQPGYDVRHTSQFLISQSTDDGLTWSAPVNITGIKDSSWWLFAPAPGRGITLDDGTLVFPTQGRDSVGRSFSNITFSRDGGKTWHTSRPAMFNTTECQAVQRSDGSIMLNMRHNANRIDTGMSNGRGVAITYDLGGSWIEHQTSRHALREPTCMAGFHRHEMGRGKRSMLLFSNPNAEKLRTHMTIKASFDDGETWPASHWLLLDEFKSRGYSCLTSINRKTIGILYESSQADMVFQWIPVSTFSRRSLKSAAFRL